jgi:hypothetical protein
LVLAAEDFVGWQSGLVVELGCDFSAQGWEGATGGTGGAAD